MRVPTLPTSIAAVLAAVMLAIPSSAGAVERGVDVDLTWDIPAGDFAPTQAAITDIGAEWVRLTMHWHDAEPSDNSYSNQTLSEWDDAVAAAEETGSKIVGVVGRSPKWASGSNNQYMPPLDPADYADFMSFLADRYEGRVAAWEIWNEQNSERFWPTGPDAAEYTQLLKAAYPAVKAADPNAIVAFGGLAYSDYFYVSQAYKAGAKGYFDVMVTHPYSDQYSPDHVTLANGIPWIKNFLAYREVHRRMVGYGDDKPIWFTEFGWSTCTTHVKCVSHAQQADYITRAFCLMEQDPYVQVALVYNLRNNHWNDDADSWETQLGLMNTTFGQKPAYSAFKNYDTSDCPAPEPAPAPAPAPEPAPEPTEDPEIDSTDEPVTEEPEGDVSTVRRRTTTRLRKVRNLRATASSTRTRPVRRHRLKLRGRVRGADGGRIRLRLRRVRRGDAVTGSASVVRTVRVRRDGTFRVRLRLRRPGKWRVRAVYTGNAEARPSRSRVVRVRI